MTKQPDKTVDALLFSRQFSTLISAGITLVRSLHALETEAPSPYAAVMNTIRMRVEEGTSLNKAIADQQALFPPFYRVMILAGEVGGILEITLNQVANLLQEDFTQSKLLGIQPMLMTDDEKPDWTRLSPAQQTLQLLLFCQAWGSMLSSGLPLLQAMEVAAESLPPTQRDEVLAAREVVAQQGSQEAIVTRMTFLPPIARTMITSAMHHGDLDTILLKLADLYRHQSAYQRSVG